MATSEGIPSSIDIEFLELNDNPYNKLSAISVLPLKNTWNICDIIMYASNPIIIEYIFCGSISYSSYFFFLIVYARIFLGE